MTATCLVLLFLTTVAVSLAFVPTDPLATSTKAPQSSTGVEVAPGPDWHARYVELWRRHQSLARRARVVERERNGLRDALRARVRLGASGLERAFLCIHGGEGVWNSNTGNGFFGGLQMDYGFERSYGSEFLRAFGPASNWTPAMQLATAERAYLSGRGFGPWPSTSRVCGLR